MRPLAILFPNTFADSSKLQPRRTALCRRYAQTLKDSLGRVGVKEIKLYLIHRVQGLPKRRQGNREELRQSSVFGFFKTLQMVYPIVPNVNCKRRQMKWSTMLVYTDLGNLNMLTRRQLSKMNLPRNSTLQKGSKTKQLALSGISTTFCTTIGARMSQAPPMGDIGFRRPFRCS